MDDHSRSNCCRHGWRVSDFFCSSISSGFPLDIRRHTRSARNHYTNFHSRGLFSISTFIASDLIPLRKRGVWQGLGNVCYGLGSGLGGVFGGYLNDVWSWRWAFLIQVPFVVISGILVWFTVDVPVDEMNKSRLKRVDFLGAGTLTAFLILLLVGLNSGGNIVPWSHPLVTSSLPLSAVFLALFVYVEEKDCGRAYHTDQAGLKGERYSRLVLRYGSQQWQYLPCFIMVQYTSKSADCLPRKPGCV